MEVSYPVQPIEKSILLWHVKQPFGEFERQVLQLSEHSTLISQARGSIWGVFTIAVAFACVTDLLEPVAFSAFLTLFLPGPITIGGIEYAVVMEKAKGSAPVVAWPGIEAPTIGLHYVAGTTGDAFIDARSVALTAPISTTEVLFPKIINECTVDLVAWNCPIFD